MDEAEFENIQLGMIQRKGLETNIAVSSHIAWWFSCVQWEGENLSVMDIPS